MIRINVQKVLDRQKANKEKPLPKVKIIKVTPRYVLIPEEEFKTAQLEAEREEILNARSTARRPRPSEPPATSHQLQTLKAQLLKEERDIHITRNKLSNYYHQLEANSAPIDAFKNNYDDIEAQTKLLQDLFLKKRHLEQYGRLPDEKPSGDHPDLPGLKLTRVRLQDKRYKIKKKLELHGKYPPGSVKHQEFLHQLDQVETELEVLHRRIKRLKE